jgi:hypothetical protein
MVAARALDRLPAAWGAPFRLGSLSTPGALAGLACARRQCRYAPLRPLGTPFINPPICCAAGDLVAYDISDPAKPRLTGRVWLGGVIAAGGGVEGDAEALEVLGLAGGKAPARPVINGVTVQVGRRGGGRKGASRREGPSARPLHPPAGLGGRSHDAAPSTYPAAASCPTQTTLSCLPTTLSVLCNPALPATSISPPIPHPHILQPPPPHRAAPR